MITVQELIDALNEIIDKSQPVEVAINQYGKAYPVAYCKLTKTYVWGKVAHIGPWNTVWLNLELPRDDMTFMYTGTKSK